MKLALAWRLPAVALLCLALAGCGAAAAPTPGQAANLSPGATPKVGDPAPGFTLQTVDGQTVSSASLANERKPYVLFFFATW
ncbi:MAG: hypothetical protein AAB289_02405 [Chloroflexota bacterium]